MEQTKYDVFISYRRVGGDRYARTIQQALEARQYKVFLDFDELKDGVFDDRIRDAIKTAPIFLLVLSKGSLNRCINEGDWVREEILYANECHSHIVPVKINDEFEDIPEELPEELKSVVKAHQFSEIQMQTLFRASMEELVRNRIEPYVKHKETATGIEVHIETDVDCNMYRFKTFMQVLKSGQDNIVRLKPGKYKLLFSSTEIPEVKTSLIYTLASDIECDYIEIVLKSQVDAERAKREVEAKRKAEEETKRKEETNAQLDLGWMYATGRGFTKNESKAVKCFRKAAEQGNARAQFNLGIMYAKGRGIQQNDEEAVKWYHKAAEQGYVKAQFNLGWRYENGHGVTKNDEEAVKWYRKAAEQGNENAKKALKKLSR